jgi:ribonuclease Y
MMKTAAKNAVFLHCLPRKPEEVDDLTAIKLARDVATKIEASLKYPGTIKVNVIRETRAEEYAK